VRACGLQLACTVLESMLGMRWDQRSDAKHKAVHTTVKKNQDGELEHQSWLLELWEEI